MNGKILVILAVSLLSFGAGAQGGPDNGGYSAMEIEHVGRCEGSFGGTFGIRKMMDGVRIRLISENPDQKDLPIRCQTMDRGLGRRRQSTVASDPRRRCRDSPPASRRIVQRAEWDFNTGLLVFTGNPVMNSDRVKGLKAERMILNFKTNNFEMENFTADRVPLSGGEAAPASASDPNLLTEADVSDWPGLINALKADLAREGANPGKQLVSKLDSTGQTTIKSFSTEQLAGQKGDLVKQINKILAAPGMYSSAAWANITLGEEVKGLLAKKTLDRAEQILQNRLLLDAAYPRVSRKAIGRDANGIAPEHRAPSPHRKGERLSAAYRKAGQSLQKTHCGAGGLHRPASRRDCRVARSQWRGKNHHFLDGRRLAQARRRPGVLRWERRHPPADVPPCARRHGLPRSGTLGVSKPDRAAESSGDSRIPEASARRAIRPGRRPHGRTAYPPLGGQQSLHLVRRRTPPHRDCPGTGHGTEDLPVG